MTDYFMDDQTVVITEIIESRKKGDNDKAMALAMQLNATAKSRGYKGDNYWLDFCKSMVEFNEAYPN